MNPSLETVTRGSMLAGGHFHGPAIRLSELMWGDFFSSPPTDVVLNFRIIDGLTIGRSIEEQCLEGRRSYDRLLSFWLFKRKWIPKNYDARTSDLTHKRRKKYLAWKSSGTLRKLRSNPKISNFGVEGIRTSKIGTIHPSHNQESIMHRQLDTSNTSTTHYAPSRSSVSCLQEPMFPDDLVGDIFKGNDVLK
ncbi:hypothetical protein CPB83DRAFT_883680, partial [Crepidotus variabilis]